MRAAIIRLRACETPASFVAPAACSRASCAFCGHLLVGLDGASSPHWARPFFGLRWPAVSILVVARPQPRPWRIPLPLMLGAPRAFSCASGMPCCPMASFPDARSLAHYRLFPPARRPVLAFNSVQPDLSVWTWQAAMPLIAADLLPCATSPDRQFVASKRLTPDTGIGTVPTGHEAVPPAGPITSAAVVGHGPRGLW